MTDSARELHREGIAIVIAKAIYDHEPVWDYRRDFAGRCRCGDRIEGGLVEHAKHQARAVAAELDRMGVLA